MAKTKLVRKIYITGEINEEQYRKFTRRLSALERENELPIDIELSSEGGTAYDALAIAGRMRSSPCELRVTAMGLVASAAVMVLAYGDKRSMTNESWVMVHEDSGDLTGDVSSMERNVKHARRMEDQWYELMSVATGTLAKNWAELHRKTTYLSAYDCQELGLIEEIV